MQKFSVLLKSDQNYKILFSNFEFSESQINKLFDTMNVEEIKLENQVLCILSEKTSKSSLLERYKEYKHSINNDMAVIISCQAILKKFIKKDPIPLDKIEKMLDDINKSTRKIQEKSEQYETNYIEKCNVFHEDLIESISLFKDKYKDSLCIRDKGIKPNSRIILKEIRLIQLFNACILINNFIVENTEKLSCSIFEIDGYIEFLFDISNLDNYEIERLLDQNEEINLYYEKKHIENSGGCLQILLKDNQIKIFIKIPLV